MDVRRLRFRIDIVPKIHRYLSVIANAPMISTMYPLLTFASLGYSFDSGALVRGVRPCGGTRPPTVSMHHICAGYRFHAWQRTLGRTSAFLRRSDHCTSSSSINSSEEHIQHRPNQAGTGHHIDYHGACTGVVDMIDANEFFIPFVKFTDTELLLTIEHDQSSSSSTISSSGNEPTLSDSPITSRTRETMSSALRRQKFSN